MHAMRHVVPRPGQPEGKRLREGRPGARSGAHEAGGSVRACRAPARSQARPADGRGADAAGGAERRAARRGTAAAGDDHAGNRGRRRRQSGVMRSARRLPRCPARSARGRRQRTRRARRGSGYARAALQHARSHAVSFGARISPSTRLSRTGCARARRPDAAAQDGVPRPSIAGRRLTASPAKRHARGAAEGWATYHVKLTRWPGKFRAHAGQRGRNECRGKCRTQFSFEPPAAGASHWHVACSPSTDESPSRSMDSVNWRLSCRFNWECCFGRRMEGRDALRGWPRTLELMSWFTSHSSSTRTNRSPLTTSTSCHWTRSRKPSFGHNEITSVAGWTVSRPRSTDDLRVSLQSGLQPTGSLCPSTGAANRLWTMQG